MNQFCMRRVEHEQVSDLCKISIHVKSHSEPTSVSCDTVPTVLSETAAEVFYSAPKVFQFLNILLQYKRTLQKV